MESELASDAVCSKCGHRAGRPIPSPEVPKPESLTLEKMCVLGYVSMAVHGVDGEVTIHVIRDYDPERLGDMISAIGDRGTENEHEIPDRLIILLAIHDGPGRPDFFLGCRVAYLRDAGREPRAGTAHATV